MTSLLFSNYFYSNHCVYTSLLTQFCFLDHDCCLPPMSTHCTLSLHYHAWLFLKTRMKLQRSSWKGFVTLFQEKQERFVCIISNSLTFFFLFTKDRRWERTGRNRKRNVDWMANIKTSHMYWQMKAKETRKRDRKKDEDKKQVHTGGDLLGPGLDQPENTIIWFTVVNEGEVPFHFSTLSSKRVLRMPKGNFRKKTVGKITHLCRLYLALPEDTMSIEVKGKFPSDFNKF